MKSLIVACLLIVTACLAPARAADMGETDVGVDWSGPWVGVLGSAGRIGGDGASLGVAAGYSAQFDRIVIGLDGDISGGSLDARRLGGRFEVDAAGGIRARVGYAFDRFVLFGTGGLAFASADYVRGGERDRKVMFGWSLGGGLDIALTERLSARAEYLYVDLDRRGFDAGGLALIGATGGLARLGVNYRF
ncbi:porin family protein [Chelatococcus sambhunathii]|uniref:Porin family protein n=1 Tax=Chelatococcus sambhunathii TaxID=363953 RepID=A0ABU1DGX4_9HYPH|nr:outer membrane beta-barrel protein [Chelatococcus sambhunathii]MDR4307380.1 porin family protein [Chelatococcus sambhunathii]